MSRALIRSIIVTVLAQLALALLCVAPGLARSADSGELASSSDYEVEYHEWFDASRKRTIPAKIFAPPRKRFSGPLPVVIFSHGYGESRDSFDYLGIHWARSGFIGIFLTHPGSDDKALGKRRLSAHDPEKDFEPRPLDIRFVTDQLERGQVGVELIEGRIDIARLGVAGQCQGATTAFYMTGLRVQRPDGTKYSEPDPRFKAVLALGPQTGAATLSLTTQQRERFGSVAVQYLFPGSWSKIDVPALVVTGSSDFNWLPAVRADPGLRRMPYESLPQGDKYHIEIRGASHPSFTGSKPYYPARPRDPRHHQWIAEASTAFLDAFLNGSKSAVAWLREEKLSQSHPEDVAQEDKTGTLDEDYATWETTSSSTPAAAPATGGLPPWFNRLDRNGDGYVSRAEIPARAERLLQGFDYLDQDSDDRLTADEVSRAYSRTRQAGGSPTGSTRTPASGMVVDVERGPHAVAIIDDLKVHDKKRGVSIPLRVFYPSGSSGPHPVIIFSHSQNGTNTDYDLLMSHWASHGYMGIVPQHADSPNSGRSSERAFSDRPKDISSLIDKLDDLMDEPELKGRIDRNRIGVGGHYLGAFASYLIAGAKRYPLTGEATWNFDDPRVSAVLLISPQGRGEGMNEDSWSDIDMPMMTMTGSGDPSRRTGNPPEWRTEPYQFSPPGDKYLVFIEGYQSRRTAETRNENTYSGIVGQPAIGYIYQASTDFWNAYLANDVQARSRLNSENLEQISDGTVKMSHK
jgi:predicted dienelactone hydrolase